MPRTRSEILTILQQNTGFARPDLWVDYALGYGFRPIKAERITHCPECGSRPSRSIGQFIYYSTLIQLLECPQCGLIWAGARIDQEVLSNHFERAYKDEVYFEKGRKAIFEHLAGVVDKYARPGARILDVGGAKGHLMHRVVVRRPDLHVTVHDVSVAATTWAATKFGFQTISGDVRALESQQQTYDVVVLSDVLYYERDLRLLWSTLQRLMAPGGSIVIRVPNVLVPIRIGQRMVNAFSTATQRMLQHRVRGFNSEHIYLFSRRYLNDHLRTLGCAEVRALPSPLSASPRRGVAQAAYFRLASVVNILSGRRLVLTPSTVLIGRRSG